MSLSNPRKSSQFPSPALAVNYYLWGVMRALDPELVGTLEKPGPYAQNPPALAKPNALPGDPNYQKIKDVMPIFPISDSAAGTIPYKDKPYFIYNTINRPTKDPFYPIKQTNILYGFKGDISETMEWVNTVAIILDRQDDVAKEINRWIRENPNSRTGEHMPIYYHSLRVLQIEPSDPGDYANDPSVITNFIVETRYHWTKDIYTAIDNENVTRPGILRPTSN